MLQPNFINNNKQGLTLGQALYGEPVVTKLNDVIKQNNPPNVSNIGIMTNESKPNPITKPNPNPNPVYDSSSKSPSTYTTDLAESSNSKSDSESESSSSSSSKSSSNSPYVPSETKFYWEYGNTGLKIKEFKNKMKRNLSIMYYVDRLFNEYIDTVLTNSYSKLFSPSSKSEHRLKTGHINSYKGLVSATIKHPKLNGTFNVREAGFMTISNIKLTDRDLKHNQIPNLDSILGHKDNIYHLTKIIKIFNLGNKMTVKSNLSNNNMSLEKITSGANSHLDALVKKDKKKKILRSGKHSGFYIKMYNNNGKGFVIDDINNLIYYVALNINFDNGSINLRYYAFDIIKGKINKIK
jgi:hypothetical protein